MMYPLSNGIILSLDCNDILNPLGSSYSDNDLRKNIAISRTTAFGNGCTDTPSFWAVNDIVSAIRSDILPTNLQTKYQSNVTRQDFCTLAIAMLEEDKINIESPVKLQNPFIDTDNEAILKLHNLGIIKGKSKTQFAPLSEITREEAASILNRIYQLLELTNNNHSSFAFSNDSKISDYANESVYNMYCAKIMKGTDNEMFAPKEVLSREQAIITILRLYNIATNGEV